MSQWLFDEQFYLDINKARWEVASSVLETLNSNDSFSIRTCLDIGCGPGWFSERIVKMGIAVNGLDGRMELVEEARRRCPSAHFTHLNIEDSTGLSGIAEADLVFCFGTLYHVENPFMLLRNLYALTRKVLLIESIIVPSNHPCAWFVDEGRNETQGLTYRSMVLSKPALFAVLSRVGFNFVYQYRGQLRHQDFIESPQKHARRTIVLAAHKEFEMDSWERCETVEWPKFDYSWEIRVEKKGVKCE